MLICILIQFFEMHKVERVKKLIGFHKIFSVIQNVMNKKTVIVIHFTLTGWKNVTQATLKPSQHSLSHCKVRTSSKLTSICLKSKIETLAKSVKHVKKVNNESTRSKIQ